MLFRPYYLPALGVMLGMAAAAPAHASLIGSQLGITGIIQTTPSAPVQTIAIPTTATVSASVVEFPMVGRLDTNIPGFFLVNTSIDAGANNLDIDFDSAGAGIFASTFQNTYIFNFARGSVDDITSATVDTSTTTLGITDANLNFTGSQLFVNVSGIRYNSSSFARINLTVQSDNPTTPTPPTSPTDPGTGPTTPVAVPEPASLLLLGFALTSLGVASRRRTRI